LAPALPIHFVGELVVVKWLLDINRPVCVAGARGG
jgi:hypothetical protein